MAIILSRYDRNTCTYFLSYFPNHDAQTVRTFGKNKTEPTLTATSGVSYNAAKANLRKKIKRAAAA